MIAQGAAHHNLPNLTTSFVGRLTEIAAISTLLDTPGCRLVTLFGPGGVGKTRLAIEVARQKQERFPDGVWFVALAPLTSPDQIPAAILKELQSQLMGEVSSSQELITFLRGKELLLVLDNFEHLLTAVRLIEDILIAAPQVKVVVTSRATLNIQAEWVQPVTGMSYPESLTSENVEHFSAVSLFAERAQRVRPDFSLAQARNCIVRICLLVEGMPLALEMAATWLKTIPCEIIADQIQRDLDFLASSQRDIPERHRSIRTVFDYSWALLSSQEQQAFPRFSVFHGGCTLEAAEAVTGASLTIMAGLVEKSLLTLEPSGRYGVHELLRQYGEEKLIASDELEAVRDAHSAYYCALLGQHEADIKGGRQVEALATIEPDVENIRAAWLRASDQRDFTAIDHALVTLDFFFGTRYRFEEFEVLMKHADQRLSPAGDEPPQRAWRRVLARPQDIVFTDETRVRCEQALTLARQYGDQAEIGVSLYWLGEVYNALDHHTEAVSCLEEALVLLRAQGEFFYVGRTLNELGRCYNFIDEPEKAIPYSQEAFNMRREINDRSGMGWCLFDLGSNYCLMGQLDEAEGYLVQAMGYFGEVRSFYGLSSSYTPLIIFSFLAGKTEQARRWGEEYLAVCKVYHSDPVPHARVRLGTVMAVTGDYEACHSLCKSGSDFPGETFYAHLGLAIAACGMRESAEARRHFLKVLEEEVLLLAYRQRFQLLSLPIAAILFAEEGKHEQSVELLALAFAGPSHRTGWIKKWAVIPALLHELETELGTTVFTAAWKRGEMLNLDVAFTTLRSQFLLDDHVQKANQNLPDPLTLRELEVLNLICAGLSNREIAAHFVVAQSTIKRHINHIYSKLAIENRTEVMARARELGLLR